MAANSICGQCQRMDEILRLSLLETYCLPILTYAAPAIKLKACQLHELNCCWNSVYRKVFGFHRWESVRVFINGLGHLDFEHNVVSSSYNNNSNNYYYNNVTYIAQIHMSQKCTVSASNRNVFSLFVSDVC